MLLVPALQLLEKLPAQGPLDREKLVFLSHQDLRLGAVVALVVLRSPLTARPQTLG